MTVQDLLAWVEATPLAVTMRESSWMFPAVESVHVIAITLVVGSVMIVDLRLLGVTSKRKPVSELATEVLPWTWAMFLLAVATGVLMFISKAQDYFDNTPFRLKMLCLALAGLNMVVFHLTAYRSVHHWDTEKPTLASAKVTGALSLIFWVGVVTFGRWIAFVETRF
jgi:hypothetical protein